MAETRTAYALTDLVRGDKTYREGEPVEFPYATALQKAEAVRMVSHGVVSWDKPEQAEESATAPADESAGEEVAVEEAKETPRRRSKR